MTHTDSSPPPEPQSAERDDLVTWTMPREDARDLLRWLRRNRPLGMPDRTFDGLIDAVASPPASETPGEA